MVLWILRQGVVGLLNNHESSPGRSTYHQMFTGTVEETGTVLDLEDRDDVGMWDGSVGKGTLLTLRGKLAMQGAYIGCDICVSGVCSIANALYPTENILKLGLAPEAMQKTYFGCLKPGDKVNLERAREIGDRNSGHCVQGHVDSWGKITKRWENHGSLFCRAKLPMDLLKYVVPQGHVAVDGTSLTVFDVNPVRGWFTFMLADYTRKPPNLLPMNVGDPVNVEVVVVGKYSQGVLVGLIPRLEQLEADYSKLQAKTTLLEARNGDLERKLQSLEYAWDHSDSPPTASPEAELWSGPKAQQSKDGRPGKQMRRNEKWFQQGPNEKKPESTMANDESPNVLASANCGPKGCSAVNGSETQTTHGGPKGRNVVGGSGTEKEKSGLEGRSMFSDSNTDMTSGGAEGCSVVGAPKAQNINDNRLRQHQRKTDSSPAQLKIKRAHGQETRMAKEDRVRQQESKTNSECLKAAMRDKASGKGAQQANEDWLLKQLKNEGTEGHPDWLRKQLKNEGMDCRSEPHKHTLNGQGAQRVNEDWLRHQQGKKDTKCGTKLHNNTLTGQQAQRVNEDWLRLQQRNSKTLGCPELHQKMASGQQAQNANKDWLRRQHETDNSLQQEIKKPTKSSQGPETDMVSGPKAQNANMKWSRQQNRKEDKVMFIGPEAQRINDEWRRQQRRGQERYTSVKRISDEDSSAVNGARADKNIFIKSVFDGHEKSRTMVGGSRAKKINDEWLRQRGMNEFQQNFGDPDGVQDATVVDRRKDSRVEVQSGRASMTSDLDRFSQQAFKVYSKGGPPPNQRPGRNLDIQDATLVDPQEDEQNNFDGNQLEEKQGTTLNAVEEDCESTHNYLFKVSQSGDPIPEGSQPLKPTHPDGAPQDPYQHTSDQQAHYEEEFGEEQSGIGEFNDGWFDNAGRSRDQEGRRDLYKK